MLWTENSEAQLIQCLSTVLGASAAEDRSSCREVPASTLGGFFLLENVEVALGRHFTTCSAMNLVQQEAPMGQPPIAALRQCNPPYKLPPLAPLYW